MFSQTELCAQKVSVTGNGILSACDFLSAPVCFNTDFAAGFIVEPFPYAQAGLSRCTAMVPFSFLQGGIALQGMAADQWLQLQASYVRAFELTRQFRVGLVGHLAFERAVNFAASVGSAVALSTRIQLDSHYVLALAVNDLMSTAQQVAPTVVVGGSVNVGTVVSADLSLSARQSIAATILVQQDVGNDFMMRWYVQTYPLQLGLGVRSRPESDFTVTLDVKMIMHLGLRTAISVELK